MLWKGLPAMARLREGFGLGQRSKHCVLASARSRARVWEVLQQPRPGKQPRQYTDPRQSGCRGQQSPVQPQPLTASGGHTPSFHKGLRDSTRRRSTQMPIPLSCL